MDSPSHDTTGNALAAILLQSKHLIDTLASSHMSVHLSYFILSISFIYLFIYFYLFIYLFIYIYLFIFISLVFYFYLCLFI